MNLSPLAREAVRRVRDDGDFLLLDCMELLDRRRGGEEGAVATMRWCGKTLLAYGDADADDVDDPAMGDCPACEGDGELSAEGSNGKTYHLSCPECDGDGCISYDGDALVPSPSELTWRSLNGEPVKVEFHGLGSSPKSWDMHDAARIVAEAKKALEAPIAEAA